MRSATVLLLAFAYHASSPVTHQADSRWTVLTAASLIQEGNLNLNEYAPKLEESGFYMIECVNASGRKFPIASLSECLGGQLFHFYPVAVSLVALPAIAAQLAVLRMMQPWLEPLAAGFNGQPVLQGYLLANPVQGYPIFELLAASFFVSIATLLFFRLAERYLDGREALLATLLFTACGPMLSTASRALWQHGIVALLLTGVLLALPRPWVGGLLALAFFVRPTAIVPMLVVGIYMALHQRHVVGRAALWAAPVIAFFVAVNCGMYGMPLAPYFFPVREGSTSLGLHTHFFEALAGTMLSPARGLLIYMPYLLLIPVSWKRGSVRWREIAPWVAAMVAGHWVLISLHSDWWGGHSFGPRYFAEITPLLMFLLLPAFSGPKKLLLVLGLIAFLIHFRGSHAASTQTWNVTPVNVNAAPARLWDWSDPPFLR